MAGLPGEVRVTLTPLGGGSSRVIEEASHQKGRVVLGFDARVTQSIGIDAARLTLRNAGGFLNEYESGSRVTVEARGSQAQEYQVIVDGYLGAPETAPVPGDDSIVNVDVVGPDTILDLAKLADELSFTGQAWTTIAGLVIDEVLGVGFARSIEADASIPTGTLNLQKGISLRQALEVIRSGLNVGSNKWEHTVSFVSGVKTYRLYKRDATMQRVIYPEQVRSGSKRNRGSFLDVVNRATVVGAESVQASVDNTPFVEEYLLLQNQGDRVAFFFRALDDALYSVSQAARRTTGQPPPNLEVTVARNPTQENIIRESNKRYRGPAPMFFFNGTSTGLQGNLDDQVTGTVFDWNIGSTGSFVTLLHLDYGNQPFGPKSVVLRCMAFFLASATTARGNVQVHGSNDNTNWTTLWSIDVGTNLNTHRADQVGAPNVTAYRYYRFGIIPTLTGLLRVGELRFIEPINLATAPANPRGIHTGNGLAVTHAANSGFTAHYVSPNDARPQFWIRIAHQSTLQSPDVNLEVQVLLPGDVTHTTVAVLPSSTLVATDTVVLGEFDWTEIRIGVRDNRVAGPNLTTSINLLDIRERYDLNNTVPLQFDAMPGSFQQWAPAELPSGIGILPKKFYSAPGLPIKSGGGYWLVYKLSGSGGSASQNWSLGNADKIPNIIPAFRSSDAGASWMSTGSATWPVGAYALEFYNGRVSYTAENTASQTKYAALAPGGVLAAEFVDEGIIGRAAARAAAEAIANRRRNPLESVVLVLDGDTTLQRGQTVGLGRGLDALLGLNIGVGPDGFPVIDVVEISHSFADGFQTILQCVEHLPDAEEAFISVATLANKRRI